MKTVSILLLLAALTGCATGSQKTAESTPGPAARTAPLAETGPAVTIPVVATSEPQPVQAPAQSSPTPAIAAGTATPASTSGWDELSRRLASWSGTVHKAMSNNCPQDVTAKP
jgi:hypothetical protein